jgi:hypothetical protein
MSHLIWLGPLVRPLVEVHWTRMVAEINGVAKAEMDLHRHLFGSDPADSSKAAAGRHRGPAGGPLLLLPGISWYPAEADHFIPASAAASMPWRISSWPTGHATTTSVTCSLAPSRGHLGTPQPPSLRQARSARQRQQVGYRPACHRGRCTLDLRPPAQGRHAALPRDQERRKGRPQPRFWPRWPMRAGRLDLSGSSRPQTLTRI